MGNNNSKDRETPTRRRRKHKSKRKKITIIVSSIAIVVLAICVGVYIYADSLLGKVNHKDIDESNLGIAEEPATEEERDKINKIVNVALLGIEREGDELGRSDATMIATFDPVHKKLKVISILRDTYVAIDGYGHDKMNHAHAFGGPELTIKTLNQNFNMNITDYVSIDFENMEQVIDAIGGVDMEMTEEEAYNLCKYTAVVSSERGVSDQPVTLDSSGSVHLSGFQALGFCRMRDFGRSDLDRADRQRKLLSVVFDKIKESGTSELASMAIKLLPHVETSLTKKEILDLAYNILTLGTSNLEQQRFPMDDRLTFADIGGGSYVCFDEAYTAKQIREYLLDDKELWNEPNQPDYIPDLAKYGGVPWGTRGSAQTYTPSYNDTTNYTNDTNTDTTTDNNWNDTNTDDIWVPTPDTNDTNTDTNTTTDPNTDTSVPVVDDPNVTGTN